MTLCLFFFLSVNICGTKHFPMCCVVFFFLVSPCRPTQLNMCFCVSQYKILLQWNRLRCFRFHFTSYNVVVFLSLTNTCLHTTVYYIFKTFFQLEIMVNLRKYALQNKVSFFVQSALSVVSSQERLTLLYFASALATQLQHTKKNVLIFSQKNSTLILLIQI